MALRQGEGKLDAFMHQKVAWHFPDSQLADGDNSQHRFHYLDFNL